MGQLGECRVPRKVYLLQHISSTRHHRHISNKLARDSVESLKKQQSYIWDLKFHIGNGEDSSLLRCYNVSFGMQLLMFQGSVLHIYRHSVFL